MGWIAPPLFFDMDGFGIKKPTKDDISLKKPNIIELNVQIKIHLIITCQATDFFTHIWVNFT